MKFSERIGLKKISVDIQLDYISSDLKNRLWNGVYIYLISILTETTYLEESKLENVIFSIWMDFLKEPIDEIPFGTENIKKNLKTRFYNWHYLEVYDFIDFLSQIKGANFHTLPYRNYCNKVLESELSGYRFVKGQLAPITNTVEISEIETAINVSKSNEFLGASIHLENALIKLSDKNNPDYRNSIKESISAVESICKVISGDPKAELGSALKKIKSQFEIHGALEKSFKSLYGYTSDGDGIRHALLEKDNLAQEDALYMLVSCSSFINYLKVKYQKMKSE